MVGWCGVGGWLVLMVVLCWSLVVVGGWLVMVDGCCWWLDGD